MSDTQPRPTMPSDEEIQRLKPNAGCIFLGIPIVATILVFIAYAWLFYHGWIGRPASGDIVEFTFKGCPEAADIVQARVADMGLGNVQLESTSDGFMLAATLPSVESRPERIASVLASPGTFEMRAGDEVLTDTTGVASSGVRLDMTMSPTTLIVLTDEGRISVYHHMNYNHDGEMTIWLDGQNVWTMNNMKPTRGGEIEIPPSAENDQARMELAAGRGIALNSGPLPCTIEVVGTTVIQMAP